MIEPMPWIEARCGVCGLIKPTGAFRLYRKCCISYQAEEGRRRHTHKAAVKKDSERHIYRIVQPAKLRRVSK